MDFIYLTNLLMALSKEEDKDKREEYKYKIELLKAGFIPQEGQDGNNN